MQHALGRTVTICRMSLNLFFFFLCLFMIRFKLCILGWNIPEIMLCSSQYIVIERYQ